MHMWGKYKGTWKNQGFTQPFDREQNMNSLFGSSVTMSKRILAVGAPFTNSVYIYEQSGIVTKLNGSTNSKFGIAVSVTQSANTLAIGASNDEGKGSVSVYIKNTFDWSLQQKIVAFDGMAYDTFGRSVFIDGNTLVVGAPNATTQKGVNSGSVCIYERAGVTWHMSSKIVPEDLSADNFFGWKVFLRQGSLFVSAYGHGNNAGAVYVFKRKKFGWHQVTKLMPSVPVTKFSFGGLVANELGSTVVVGASQANAVFVFERNAVGWNETDKIVGLGGGEFGESVAVSCGSILVGAPGNGRVYLYSVTSSTCGC